MHPRSPCQRQPHFRGSIEGKRLPAKTQISKYISKLDNPSIQHTGIFCSAAILIFFGFISLLLEKKSFFHQQCWGWDLHLGRCSNWLWQIFTMCQARHIQANYLLILSDLKGFMNLFVKRKQDFKKIEKKKAPKKKLGNLAWLWSVEIYVSWVSVSFA